MIKTIEINDISKKYLLHHQNQSSGSTLVETLSKKSLALCKQLFSRKRSMTHSHSCEEFWALKDVSFSIEEGDRVGIIGKNGAGKSTLLKILSRITEPTSGTVKMRGRLSSLLEVGTGFHPELTGRENIFLNGAILGMTRSEIKKKFDEIVAFAEIEQFLDTPVKRFSSGMYMRLGFAIAAHLDSDIMIIDEVLAVGDSQFQSKCFTKLNELGAKGRTVIFVSHDLGSVLSLCNKGIYLEKGKVVESGNIDKCVSSYMKNHTESISWKGNAGDEHIRFYNVFLEGDKAFFYQGESPKLIIEYEVLESDPDLFMGIVISNAKHQLLAHAHTFDGVDSHHSFGIKGKHRLSFPLAAGMFHEGNYLVKIICSIHNKKRIIQDEIVLKFPVYSNQSNTRFKHALNYEGIILGDEWKWHQTESSEQLLFDQRI